MKGFDLQSLQQLLCDFYNLTNIKVCLYDFEENELCFYPKKLSSFCEILRTDEKYDKLCKSCDSRAFAMCRKTRSQYIYTCHAGLRECVSPIICDDRILGFIMLGQIKSATKSDFTQFEKKLPAHLKEQLYATYDSLPTISNEKLLSAFHILDACTGYEALKILLQNHNNSIESKIDKYIHEHLSKQLSVAILCSEFHLSRHEIYNICNKYFHCGPAEYIKKCRLSYACKLLTTTDLFINEIAMRCGFFDYNYFSKVFKSKHGISPTEYKKRHASTKE